MINNTPITPADPITIAKQTIVRTSATLRDVYTYVDNLQ